ncbi:MAG: hypothetical protein IH984_11805 [Planctomycetes bacterium]|nr:hypothetical protein [Planctomycetota bacterium]
MRKTTLCGLSAALLFVIPAMAGGTTQYNDRPTFESTLGTIIIDDYEDKAYQHGDVLDIDVIDIHSNAQMNSIFGETDYFTTQFANWNIIQGPVNDRNYCAGCNGSYEVSFTTTSVGSASGVFGVGFNIEGNSAALPYHAFITFGDNSTLDVALPVGASFWGITSNLEIQSIHLGLENGGATNGGSFVMDDLTIGDSPGSPCPWDLDGSGSVGTSDLLELFAQWGTAGSADFDGSGVVDTGDLLTLFANWGPC